MVIHTPRFVQRCVNGFGTTFTTTRSRLIVEPCDVGNALPNYLGMMSDERVLTASDVGRVIEMVHCPDNYDCWYFTNQEPN